MADLKVHHFYAKMFGIIHSALLDEFLKNPPLRSPSPPLPLSPPLLTLDPSNPLPLSPPLNPPL